MAINASIASLIYLDNRSPSNNNVKSCSRIVFVSSPLIDIAITAVLLTLGILSTYNVLHFSPAATWGMIGAGVGWGVLSLPSLFFYGLVIKGG